MTTSLSIALSLSLLSIAPPLPKPLLLITTTDTASIPEKIVPEVISAPRGLERKAVQAVMWPGPR